MSSAEVLAPVLLDLADHFLVALEPIVHRLEHRGERFARGRFALLEALVGALEELLLRAFEHLAADFGELRAERLLGGIDFGEPFLERLLALVLRRDHRSVARGKFVMLARRRRARSHARRAGVERAP